MLQLVIVPASFEEQVDVILDKFKKDTAFWWNTINPDTGKSMLEDYEMIYPICVKKFKGLFVPVKLPEDMIIECSGEFKGLVIPDNLLERCEIIFDDIFMGVQENYDDLNLVIEKIQSLFY